MEKYLKAKIDASLRKEVFEKVRDVEQKNIDQTVYHSYTPKVYERRHMQGGLIAAANIIGNVTSAGILEVKNIASSSPSLMDGSVHSSFPTWIEQGKSPVIHGIDKEHFYISKSERFPARPFTQNTLNDLKQSRQHVEAMKTGLKKQGLQLK